MKGLSFARLAVESLFRPETAAFRRLCSLEPGLRILYDEARMVRPDPAAAVFCATVVFHDHFKPRADALLGDLARHPAADLGCDNYRAVYAQILRALPRCRRCNCW